MRMQNKLSATILAAVLLGVGAARLNLSECGPGLLARPAGALGGTDRGGGLGV